MKTRYTAFSSNAANLKSDQVYFDNVEISNVVVQSDDKAGRSLFNYGSVFRKYNVTNAPGITIGIYDSYFVEYTMNL